MLDSEMALPVRAQVDVEFSYFFSNSEKSSRELSIKKSLRYLPSIKSFIVQTEFFSREWQIAGLFSATMKSKSPAIIMTSIKNIALIAALASGLALTANAATITISPFGDVPKNGTGINGGNSNNAENNFFRLQTYLANNPEFNFCTPISLGAERIETNLGQPVDVTGFDYAVVHYGAGKGGTKGSGGGVAFFQISGDGSVTFPQNGSGPNGKGGISSLDLFKCEEHNVPDSGATLMLLGGALTGLGLVRRYIKR